MHTADVLDTALLLGKMFSGVLPPLFAPAPARSVKHVTLVLGMAPPRSGTHSLQILLDGQQSFKVTHELEGKYVPSWEVSPTSLQKVLASYDEKILQAAVAAPARAATRSGGEDGGGFAPQFAGDVSYFNLPYAEYLLARFQDAQSNVWWAAGAAGIQVSVKV